VMLVSVYQWRVAWPVGGVVGHRKAPNHGGLGLGKSFQASGPPPVSHLDVRHTHTHIGRHGAEVCLREGPQQDQVVAVGDPAEHDEEHVRLEGVVS